MIQNYKNKYLKYKNKYLKLKNNYILFGGDVGILCKNFNRLCDGNELIEKILKNNENDILDLFKHMLSLISLEEKNK